MHGDAHRDPDDPAIRSRFSLLTAAAYLVTGIAVFSRILWTQFLSDDWEFLIIVERAQSVWTSFEPLVGRFVRPFVVLLYYVNFKLFGLNPLPYHLTLVLVHVVNAWLVCLLAIRLDAERRRWIGFCAGLLFLLFAGHAEAVSWVAGAADPLLVPFLIGSLLLFARGLDADRPTRWFALAWVLFVLSMLAKEVGAIIPALAVAYAAVHALRTNAWRTTLARTAIFVAVPAILLAGFFLLRARLFGAPFGAYAELGPKTTSVWVLSAFVLRTFLPPMKWVARMWLEHRHLVPIAGIAIAFIAALVREWIRGRDWQGLAFSLAAVAISLAPVLPLSIAIFTTESERYVYVATVFSCIAIAQLAAALLPARLAIGALAIVTAVNAAYLDKSNRTFKEAGILTDGMLRSLIDVLRAEPPPAHPVFLLNSPDNMNGAYVFRRGFLAALHLHAPDLDPRPIQVLATQTASSARESYASTQIDARTLTLDIRPQLLFEKGPPFAPYADFIGWSRSGFTVRFKESVPTSLILALDRGRIHVAARMIGLGFPFGVIDTPKDPAVCAGDRLRLAGWALDDEEVAEVIVERDRADAPASRLALGTAIWTYNTRPDIAAAYPRVPHLEKAGWEFQMPCSIAASAPNRRVRVHVVAIDKQRQRADLGERTITASAR